MTAAANILAGMRVTAAMIQGVAPTAAIKPADQSVTSSTTLVNDSDLSLSLPASTTWVFFGMLGVTGAAISTGDIKVNFTVPTGSTLVYEAFGFSPSGTTTQMNTVRPAGTTSSVGVNGTSESPVILLGSLVVSTTAGNLQLQWAQNVSSGTSTTVKTGSFLTSWQIA